jgi:competence protein ComEA
LDGSSTPPTPAWLPSAEAEDLLLPPSTTGAVAAPLDDAPISPSSSRGRHHRARSAEAGRAEGRAVRLDPGRRGAVVLGLVVLIAAAVTAWWVLLGRPHVAAVPMTTTASAGSSATRPAGAAATFSAAGIVVDVVGRVRRPGVYHLAVGARVEDALRAAGGGASQGDLASINLARKLIDGEQIAVGVPGAAPPAVASATSGGAGAPVDLNTATAEQLDALPGVGPVLAQHVMDWRTAHGRFDSVDQLREVSGIGPSKFADLKPLVTV